MKPAPAPGSRPAPAPGPGGSTGELPRLKARRRSHPRAVVEVEAQPDPTPAASTNQHVVRFTFPRADGELAAWMVMAGALFIADPDRFGLARDDAAELDQLARTFSAALDAIASPADRTTEAIRVKNVARDRALAAFRGVMARIRLDASITPAAKCELGFLAARPRTGRRPIEPPSTPPILSIGAVGDGSHTLRFADSATPTKRAKPAGAAAMQLLIMLDDRMHTVPDEMAGLIRRATRSPFTVDFRSFDPGSPPPDAGLTATYFGRWMTATGKPGPWSLPVAMTVAYAMRPPGAGEP